MLLFLSLVTRLFNCYLISNLNLNFGFHCSFVLFRTSTVMKLNGYCDGRGPPIQVWELFRTEAEEGGGETWHRKWRTIYSDLIHNSWSHFILVHRNRWKNEFTSNLYTDFIGERIHRYNRIMVWLQLSHLTHRNMKHWREPIEKENGCKVVSSFLTQKTPEISICYFMFE